MMLPHMSLICSRMIKFFRTKFTGEWLLISMRSEMELVCFCVKKPFLTFYVIFVNEITFVRTLVRMKFSTKRQFLLNHANAISISMQISNWSNKIINVNQTIITLCEPCTVAID